MDDTVLFESAAITEFLDETVSPSLHPCDPLERARDRAWIEFISRVLGTEGRTVQRAEDERVAQAAGAEIKAKLQRLEDEVVGPFFGGPEFRLIDASAAPLLQRMFWCDDAGQLGMFADLPNVTAWWAALEAHPAVMASTVEDGQRKFMQLLSEYGSWVGSVATTNP